MVRVILSSELEMDLDDLSVTGVVYSLDCQLFLRRVQSSTSVSTELLLYSIVQEVLIKFNTLYYE